MKSVLTEARDLEWVRLLVELSVVWRRQKKICAAAGFCMVGRGSFSDALLELSIWLPANQVLLRDSRSLYDPPWMLPDGK